MAGVSSIATIIKNLFFVVPIAAKLLGYKWYLFYPQVGTATFCSSVIIVLGVIVRIFMPTDTWFSFWHVL